MCRYTVETCEQAHEASRHRKFTPCSDWERGYNRQSCTYVAAFESGQVDTFAIPFRICRECVREIFNELKRNKEYGVSNEGEGVDSSELSTIPSDNEGMPMKNTQTKKPPKKTEKPASNAQPSKRQKGNDDGTFLAEESDPGDAKKQSDDTGANTEAEKSPGKPKSSKKLDLGQIPNLELDGEEKPKPRRSSRPRMSRSPGKK